MTAPEEDAMKARIDALNHRLDEFDSFNKERFEHAKQSVAFALASSERAIAKAEAATEKRFESVNEFRATLADQNTEFVRNAEYKAAHESLAERVTSVDKQVISLTSKIPAPFMTGPSLVISAISVVIIIIVSIVTGAIKLGEVQTHVLINTGTLNRLVEREREQDVRFGKIENSLNANSFYHDLNSKQIQELRDITKKQ